MGKHSSTQISVSVGTRQGGLSSPFLKSNKYICLFDNPLLHRKNFL